MSVTTLYPSSEIAIETSARTGGGLAGSPQSLRSTQRSKGGVITFNYTASGSEVANDLIVIAKCGPLDRLVDYKFVKSGGQDSSLLVNMDTIDFNVPSLAAMLFNDSSAGNLDTAIDLSANANAIVAAGGFVIAMVTGAPNVPTLEGGSVAPAFIPGVQLGSDAPTDTPAARHSGAFTDAAHSAQSIVPATGFNFVVPPNGSPTQAGTAPVWIALRLTGGTLASGHKLSGYLLVDRSQ